MAVYVADMIDQLREMLGDDADAQVSFAKKVMFLNRGQGAMFPKVFNLSADATLTLVSGTYEYTIPSAVSGGKILLVEVETSSSSSRFVRWSDYDIVPSSHTGPKLVFHKDPSTALNGSSVRITAALPMTRFTSANYTAAGSEAYTGPEYTAELPVLYAMSLCHLKALDPRMDYGKFSVQNQNNAAEPNDIMGAAQFWMEQFRFLLEQHAMPLPSTGI